MECLTKSPLQERRLEKLRFECVCVWKVLAEIACIDVGRDVEVEESSVWPIFKVNGKVNEAERWICLGRQRTSGSGLGKCAVTSDSLLEIRW